MIGEIESMHPSTLRIWNKWKVSLYYLNDSIKTCSGRKCSMFLIGLQCLCWTFWHFYLVFSSFPGFLVFLAMAVYTGVTINYYGKRYGNWRFSWSYIIGWVSVVLTFFSGRYAKSITRKLPNSICCHFNQTESRKWKKTAANCFNLQLDASFPC